MSRTDPNLTRAQTMELFIAVLINAEDLVMESRLLMDSRRFSRAYALAHLAHEEVAKCFGLLNIWVVSGLSPEAATWAVFWDKWRSHSFKVQLALAGDAIRQWAGQQQTTKSSELPIDIEDRVRALHDDIESAIPKHSDLTQLREDALYVDRREGRVVEPRQVISKDMAEGMVSAATANCAFLRSIVDIGLEHLIDIGQHPAMRDIESVWSRIAESRKTEL